jgi:hypothetical protein
VENPALLLQALDTRAQNEADQRLAGGPEGAWGKDLAVVAQILKRLIGQVPILFAPTQERAECARLRQAFASTKTQFQRLEQALAAASDDDR